MAVALRLMRFGKKKFPFYRIVALDRRQKRDGAYIEKIGQYDPMKEHANIEINKVRFDYWQSQGAQISEGLTRLIKNPKNIVYTEEAK